jgi:molecular chaperone GrpE (heat shock protein)
MEEEMEKSELDALEEMLKNEVFNAEQENLEEIVLNTREQGQMLENLIRSKIEPLIENQIKVKDEMISKLYDELKFYKEGEAVRFENQLIKAIIKVRRNMLNYMKSNKWSNSDVDMLKDEYEGVLMDIDSLLELQNVDPYTSNPGDDFDKSIHEAKIEITDNIELDKKIKESIKEGYKKDGKVLVTERVLVYKVKN